MQPPGRTWKPELRKCWTILSSIIVEITLLHQGCCQYIITLLNCSFKVIDGERKQVKFLPQARLRSSLQTNIGIRLVPCTVPLGIAQVCVYTCYNCIYRCWVGSGLGVFSQYGLQSFLKSVTIAAYVPLCCRVNGPIGI